MKKEVKIILYCVLAVILIVVCCLVWWKSKQQAWEPENFTTEQEITEVANTHTDTTQPSQNFEQDVMNDLESFFNDNNGYENIQWEFWFISSEN